MINQNFALVALCLLCTVTLASGTGTNAINQARQQAIDSLNRRIWSLAAKNDETSRAKSISLKSLAEALESDDCSEMSFARLKVWVDDKSVAKAETRDLLGLIRRDLFDRCRTSIRDKLTSRVETKLTSSQRKMALGIAKQVAIANHGESDFTDSTLATGIAAYLKRANFMTRTKSRHILMMSWRTHIIEACYAVNNNVNSVTYVYRAIDDESKAKLDSFEREWELASRVCSSTLHGNFLNDGGLNKLYQAL